MATDDAPASIGAVAEPLDIAAGLLGQETPPDSGDEPARREGAALLAHLTDLQIALLSPVQTDARKLVQALSALRDGADGAAAASDPKLAGTLAAIRLRVRIELARHEPEP